MSALAPTSSSPAMLTGVRSREFYFTALKLKMSVSIERPIAKPSGEFCPQITRSFHITCAADHPLLPDTLSSPGFQNLAVCLHPQNVLHSATARASACSVLYHWWQEQCRHRVGTKYLLNESEKFGEKQLVR